MPCIDELLQHLRVGAGLGDKGRCRDDVAVPDDAGESDRSPIGLRERLGECRQRRDEELRREGVMRLDANPVGDDLSGGIEQRCLDAGSPDVDREREGAFGNYRSWQVVAHQKTFTPLALPWILPPKGW